LGKKGFIRFVVEDFCGGPDAGGLALLSQYTVGGNSLCQIKPSPAGLIGGNIFVVFTEKFVLSV
jgi:hypothetical protein